MKKSTAKKPAKKAITKDITLDFAWPDTQLSTIDLLRGCTRARDMEVLARLYKEACIRKLEFERANKLRQIHEGTKLLVKALRSSQLSIRITPRPAVAEFSILSPAIN